MFSNALSAEFSNFPNFPKLLPTVNKGVLYPHLGIKFCVMCIISCICHQTPAHKRPITIITRNYRLTQELNCAGLAFRPPRFIDTDFDLGQVGVKNDRMYFYFLCYSTVLLYEDLIPPTKHQQQKRDYRARSCEQILTFKPQSQTG